MTKKYSKDPSTEENWNTNDKYSQTGESEFSRESTIPFDQDEVLSERHYNLSPVEELGKKQLTRRKTSLSHRPNFKEKGLKNHCPSDNDIRENISETLYRSGEVDASQIQVFVAKGQVKLKGEVKDWHQKRLAEFLIEKLAGVNEILNELKVKEHRPGRQRSRYGLTDNITGLN